VSVPSPSITAIFLVFFRIGLLSFGGGLSGWMFREVVLLRHWLDEDEFLSGMALGQILPGANVANLTIFIGQRLRGLAGAAAGLFGLLVGPFFAVLARSAVRRPSAALAFLATFAAVGVMHWSLLMVVAVVGPLSVWAAWPKGA
jgi:chromate transporter